MKTIWKYEIRTEENVYEMPKGAKILSAQLQGGKICIWALVDTEVEKEIRIIEVFGTGLAFKVKKNWVYIGTVQVGWFVGHVFEILK
jgi:hypothetical protein